MEGEERGRHEPRCAHHTPGWCLPRQREGCCQRDKLGCPQSCVSTGQKGRCWSAESTGRTGIGGCLTLTSSHASCACGHHQSQSCPGSIPAVTGAAGRAGCAQPMGRVLLPVQDLVVETQAKSEFPSLITSFPKETGTFLSNKDI